MLDGYVGQAILLNDSAQLAKVESWMQHLISQQAANAGWLGPSVPEIYFGMTYWPVWPVLYAFFQWYEYTGDAAYIASALQWSHAAAVRVRPCRGSSNALLLWALMSCRSIGPLEVDTS